MNKHLEHPKHEEAAGRAASHGSQARSAGGQEGGLSLKITAASGYNMLTAVGCESGASKYVR